MQYPITFPAETQSLSMGHFAQYPTISKESPNVCIHTDLVPRDSPNLYVDSLVRHDLSPLCDEGSETPRGEVTRSERTTGPTGLGSKPGQSRC